VQGAVDDGGDPLFGIMPDDGVFEDGLAGSGLAEDEAGRGFFPVKVLE
jgi:hypothetical protein